MTKCLSYKIILSVFFFWYIFSFWDGEGIRGEKNKPFKMQQQKIISHLIIVKKKLNLNKFLEMENLSINFMFQVIIKLPSILHTIYQASASML